MNIQWHCDLHALAYGRCQAATASSCTLHSTSGEDSHMAFKSPSCATKPAIKLLLCIVTAVLLISNAAALKVTVAGRSIDLNHPLAPRRAAAQSHGSTSSLIDAICPITSASQVQITPFPIKFADVCGNFGLNIANNAYACMAFGQMGSIMGNPPPRCAPDAIPLHLGTDSQGVPIPQPLPDRRQDGQLPEHLPAQTVLESEGATFSWLHSHIQRIYLWATCAEQGNTAAWQAPAGWHLRKMVHIANGWNAAMGRMHSHRLAAGSLPFMAILKQSAESRASSSGPCNAWAAKAATGSATASSEELCKGGVLLFVIRGTATPYEWTLDYNYKMRADSNYGPGIFHEGFLAVANQLWDNGMKDALDAALSAGDVQHVIITGHSLGAASTKLLSARAQAYMDRAVAAQAHIGGPTTKQSPSITAVMFGGPNVGNAAFASHFNRHVNARNVQYVHDMIYQVPCAGKISACNILEVPVPTGQGSATGSWSYARVGGQVHLDTSHIPIQRDAWSMLAEYTQHDYCREHRSVTWNVDALHYCSYSCILGAYAGQNSWCKLWRGTSADQGASYCFHGVDGAAFPKTPMFPFM